MKMSYEAPTAEPFGTVEEMTGALGNEVAPDVGVFPRVPAQQGSFDICEELVCDD